jgi:hypothetical protein
MGRPLATAEGIAPAIARCKDTAITEVFLAIHRRRCRVDAALLGRARDGLRAAGGRRRTFT